MYQDSCSFADELHRDHGEGQWPGDKNDEQEMKKQSGMIKNCQTAQGGQQREQTW